MQHATSNVKHPGQLKTQPMKEAMEKWFRQASSEQCDTMLALQLDYRFEGDVFASLWWSHFQKIGFKHTGTSYEVPSSFPHSQKEYVANEMYHILDSLAVPQLVSSFQLENGNNSSVNSPIALEQMSLEETNWWKRIRRQLIFAEFHTNIEKQHGNQQSRDAEAELDDNGDRVGSRRRTRSANQQCKPSDGKKNPKSGSKRAFVTDAGADLYIRRKKRAKGKAKSKSSYNRDDEPMFPTIDQYVAYAKDYQNDDLKVVEESISQAFGEWRFLLATNQSLLLYGVGSKRAIFNEFVSTHLRQHGAAVIAVNGFDKTVTIEGILDLLVHQLLKGHEPQRDLHDMSLLEHYDTIANGLTYARQGDPDTVQRAKAIGKALSRQVLETLKPVYLVIHSIDGSGLRNPTAREALAALVFHSLSFECGQNAVRLAASVDHINSPMLLWDPTLQASFRWARRRISTLCPYINEIVESDLFDNQKNTKGSKSSAKALLHQDQRQLLQNREDAESIFDILTSFAPRLTQSLHQLVQLQLEKKVDWIEYSDLFRKCKLSFTVSSDHQLRNFLGELIDHNVVVVDNSQRPPRYRVPYSSAGMRKILKFKHNKG